MGILEKLFGNKQKSGSVAKDRLRLVLVQDRANLSPEMMDSLRNELISVISHYMEIDETNLDVELSKEGSQVALVANIPIKSVKRKG